MTQPTTTNFPRTIGMDLGSRNSSACIVSRQECVCVKPS